jgi:hypothetical protein
LEIVRFVREQLFQSGDFLSRRKRLIAGLGGRGSLVFWLCFFDE